MVMDYLKSIQTQLTVPHTANANISFFDRSMQLYNLEQRSGNFKQYFE